MAAKVRRIDFSPDEWIAGTVGLTNAERGLYITVCALIYSHGGPIQVGNLLDACRDHGSAIKAQLGHLLALGKITRNGEEIDQKRCQRELANARKRAGKARENGAKGGRPNRLAKPGGYANGEESGNARETDTEYNKNNDVGKPDGSAMQDWQSLPKGREKVEKTRHNSTKSKTSKNLNHQPSVRDSVNPLNRGLQEPLTARDASPPLPSRGDGVAALRAREGEGEQSAPSVFDDPQLKAYGLARLDQCLDAIRGKLGVLESDATVPPPPDPQIVEFRARLQRLNALAGERLEGNTQWRAWEIIAEASTIGDPDAIPPPMWADLAAIESLGVGSEAAE